MSDKQKLTVLAYFLEMGARPFWIDIAIHLHDSLTRTQVVEYAQELVEMGALGKGNYDGAIKYRVRNVATLAYEIGYIAKRMPEEAQYDHRWDQIDRLQLAALGGLGNE